jgi:DNA repair protein RadD
MQFTEEEIRKAFPRAPWDHQMRGLVEMFQKLQRLNTVALCSPTGGGKGLMQSAILNLLDSRGMSAIIYNPRRILTKQSFDRLEADGIHHGVRAAGHRDMQNLHARFQVASIQTDVRRVLQQGAWGLHPADLVLVDEAHLSASGKSLELWQAYLSRGSKIVGITGTPLEIDHVYKEVVVAGTNSELRECKAHVPAKMYSLHEMDVEKVARVKTGEYSEGDISKHLWSHAVVGHIYEDYRALNENGWPALAAAPGIGEAVWLSEEFRKHGHRVAHIDSRECIVNGERYKNDAEGVVREQVLSDMRKGEFDLLSNCEVIQQGVDLPNIGHLILARPYGSLSNCLQVYGRAIRYSDSTPDYVIIQDHGGNYHRHGHADEDRPWHELFYMTEKDISEQREQRMKDEEAPEPIRCPQCGMVRESGARCPGCGHISDKRQRIIVQQDGKLVLKEGKVYKRPPRPPMEDPTQKWWDRIYYSFRNARTPLSFAQARAAYERDTGQPLPKGLKRIPRSDDRDAWQAKIKFTSFDQLT